METYKLEFNYEQLLVLQEAIDRARKLPDLEETVYSLQPGRAEHLFTKMLDDIELQLDEVAPRINAEPEDDK